MHLSLNVSLISHLLIFSHLLKTCRQGRTPLSSLLNLHYTSPELGDSTVCSAGAPAHTPQTHGLRLGLAQLGPRHHDWPRSPSSRAGLTQGFVAPEPSQNKGRVLAEVILGCSQPWGGGMAVKQPLQTVQPEGGSAPRDGSAQGLWQEAGPPPSISCLFQF